MVDNEFNDIVTDDDTTDVAAAAIADMPKRGKAESPVRRFGDPYLWGIYIFLCLVSLVITYDAAGREIKGSNVFGPLIKQVMFLVAGGFIAFFIQKIDYKKIVKFIPYFALLTFIGLFYVDQFGEVINGAQRHISIMGFSIQPTEMAKLAVVLLLAWIMARNQMENGVRWTGIFLCFLVIAMFGYFLVKQGLTNTLLLMSITVAMILVSGTQWRKILTLVGVFAALILLLLGVMLVRGALDDTPETDSTTSEIIANIAPVENTDNTNNTEYTSTIIKMIDAAEEVIVPYIPRFETHANRLRDFFDPRPLYTRPFTEKNNQAMFATMAQASGGAGNVGIGNSKYSSMLPLAFSDYVFSIIVEDTGLVGGVILLIVYLLILARAGNIAQKCKKAIPALMVIGLAFMIVIQALFHMAINTGVFPVSGQPLPLISMGGTSILIISVAFGIMQSVCRTARMTTDKKADINAEMEALPVEMRADNSAN